MKSTTTTTLFAFFFLFTFISHALADKLIDTDGNILRNGGTYYILPADREAGGSGIERVATGRERCPLTVVQSPSEHSRGLPIRIASHFRIGIVKEGLPLQLYFDSPACGRELSAWTVVKGQREGVASVKLTGEEEGSGTFYIERAGMGYKLVFCSDRCSHIGIYVDDDGNRRLVAAADRKPFVVRFKKVQAILLC